MMTTSQGAHMDNMTRRHRYIATRAAEGLPILDAILAWNAAEPRDQAPDTLATIAAIATDPVFAERLRASAQKEGAPGDPAQFVWDHRYAYGAQPGWAASVDYWLLTNPDAGGQGWQNDPAVITDGSILAATNLIANPPAPDLPEALPS